MGVVINMADSSSLSPIITVLLSGIIAVASSYFTNYFLKKDRLGIEVKSKHRQDWINSLRTDIAYICAKANFIVFNLSAIISYEKDKNSGGHSDPRGIIAYNELEEKAFKVVLFLNLNNCDQKCLDKKIKKLKEKVFHFADTSQNTEITTQKKLLTDDINELIDEITSISQAIFKSEWERIKKGE